MKNIIRLSVAVLLAAVMSNVVLSAEPQRLMSYNIRNAKGLDGSMDVGRIASVIDRISPAVVAIQEIDSITGRSYGCDILAEIAGLTGMHHVYAPAIDYDGGKYGVGILCNDKPVSVLRVGLPGSEEARTLLAVEFDDYVFACTHLSLTEVDRLASITTIDSVAALFDKPFFIAGDFNSHLGDPFMQEFTRRFTILSTVEENSFPADNPVELIDYIAVCNSSADAVEVRGSKIVEEPLASDHRPVYADIELQGMSEAMRPL